MPHIDIFLTILHGVQNAGRTHQRFSFSIQRVDVSIGCLDLRTFFLPECPPQLKADEPSTYKVDTLSV